MENMVYEILEEITGENLTQEPDSDLFESGRLDSLGMIEFLVSLESKTNIVLDPSMIDRNDFNTPGKIIRYLQNLKRVK